MSRTMSEKCLSDTEKTRTVKACLTHRMALQKCLKKYLAV